MVGGGIEPNTLERLKTRIRIKRSKTGPNKKTCINNELFNSSKLQTLVYKAGAPWRRLFLPGAGADPIWLEPESAPGP